MADEEGKDAIIERTVLVAADRVDALVRRDGFHALSKIRALNSLRKCVDAAMSETDHLNYDIKTRSAKNQIYVYIKLFEDTDLDYDIQLRYSITEGRV